MRLEYTLLLAIMLTPAAAQRGGGMPGGRGPGGPPPGFPSPGPNPPVTPGRGHSGFGQNGPWHGRGPYVPRTIFFYFPYVPWSDGSICSPSPFPTYWNDSCNGYNNPGPSDPTLFANPPVPPPPILPEPQPIPDPAPLPAQASYFPTPQERELPPPASPKRDRPPNPGNDARESYPALIVLKAGGMYSATRYWVTKNMLYFATTQGQTLYAPLAEVDRIYPPQPASQPR